MSEQMKAILTRGWHFMRIVRLVIGIVFLVYAVVRNDYMVGAISLFLILVSIFNVGCGGGGGCAVPQKTRLK